MTPLLETAAVAIIVASAVLALARLLRRNKSPGCSSCPAKKNYPLPRR
jgi:hypothetical protein